CLYYYWCFVVSSFGSITKAEVSIFRNSKGKVEFALREKSQLKELYEFQTAAEAYGKLQSLIKNPKVRVNRKMVRIYCCPHCGEDLNKGVFIFHSVGEEIDFDSIDEDATTIDKFKEIMHILDEDPQLKRFVAEEMLKDKYASTHTEA
ncbi:MAG: hypothetical protein ACFFDT_36210, partial [Candidatus Hodarchaeota archaeon]